MRHISSTQEICADISSAPTSDAPMSSLKPIELYMLIIGFIGFFSIIIYAMVQAFSGMPSESSEEIMGRLRPQIALAVAFLITFWVVGLSIAFSSQKKLDTKLF